MDEFRARTQAVKKHHNNRTGFSQIMRPPFVLGAEPLPLQFDAQLRERHEDKIPLLRPRMRKGEFGIIHLNATEVYKIDIDRTRTVADETHSSHIIFNGVHPVRKFMRRKIRFKYGRLIQEFHPRKLFRHIYGLCFDYAANFNEFSLWQNRKKFHRSFKMRGAISDIRSETYDSSGHYFSITYQRMQKKWQTVPASTKRCQIMCENSIDFQR